MSVMWPLSYLIASLARKGAALLDWEERAILRIGPIWVGTGCAIVSMLSFIVAPVLGFSLLFIAMGWHVLLATCRYTADPLSEPVVPSWMVVPAGFIVGILSALMIAETLS